MMNIVTRKATVEDIPVIQHIAYTTWPVAYGDILSAAQMKYMLDAWYNTNEIKKQIIEGQLYFIFTVNAESLGYAAFGVTDKPGVYKLHKLYVLPSAQGTGAGKALLQTVIAEAKNMGGTALTLNVNRYNKAWKFYNKMGFEIVKEYDLDIGSGYYMNDYIMQLTL